MGLLITIILAVASFFVAKSVVNSKPEIAQWSVNKKQALTLAWFALSVLVFLCIKVAIQPDQDIVQQFLGSFGISIIMGMIFYKGLNPKKQTA